MSFRRSYRGSCGGCHQRCGLSQNTSQTALSIPCFATLWSHSEIQKINLARDLQERLGILALLALPAPFRICKLQISLTTRRTDPVLATTNCTSRDQPSEPPKAQHVAPVVTAASGSNSRSDA